MNVMLVITLFIIIFCILQGYRKGALDIIYRLVSFVILLIFIAVVHTPIENSLRENTSIYETIYEKAEEHLNEKQADTGLEAGVEAWWNNLIGDLPDSQALLDEIELPEGVDISSLLTLNSSYVANYQAQIVASVTKGVADFIMRGIGILCAAVLGCILLIILRMLLKFIGKLPVIRGVNRFFGLFAGVIEGFFVVWVLMYIGALLVTTTLGQAMLNDIEESAFLTFLYDNNLIVTLLEYI